MAGAGRLVGSANLTIWDLRRSADLAPRRSALTISRASAARFGQYACVAPDAAGPDASLVARSATGVFLCGEPCGPRNACRMGILAARREDENSVSFDIECPHDYRETPNLAHTSWTAGVMSEMCGQLPLFFGIMAFTGTVTTRFQAPVPIGERLIGRATFEGRERRKVFVDATLISAVTGTELAKASAITIAVEMRNLEDRGLT
jgi:acyl dehydratase